MTALGLAVRPDLLAMIQTTDTTDKKALDRLCDSASEAGGATARRDLGTALHKMFEQSCVTPGYQPPPTYAADIQAIHTALREAGLQVVDECSELMVVLDRYQIAGMADLVVERISDGELFIADLKTGSSVAYGALGWAIQLAIYANADNIYLQGPEADGSADARAPMVDVNKQQAFIIHCQPQSGACDLHTLDIGKGFEALETAISVREWRKQKKLLLPFEGTSSVESRSMVALDGPAAGPMTPEPTAVAQHITAVESAIVERDHMVMLRTLWLLERIRLLGVAGHIEQVQQYWPQWTAGPKAVRSQEAAWSIADITAVIRCVDAVEAATDTPFGATDPELAHTMAVAQTQQLLDGLAGAEPRRGAPTPLKGGSPP
jgi:hypothetical protein